jgi:hypothetical protein
MATAANLRMIIKFLVQQVLFQLNFCLGSLLTRSEPVVFDELREKVIHGLNRISQLCQFNALSLELIVDVKHSQD